MDVTGAIATIMTIDNKPINADQFNDPISAFIIGIITVVFLIRSFPLIWKSLDK